MSNASASSILLYGVCTAAASTDAALQAVCRDQVGVGGAPLSLERGDALAVLRSQVDPAVLRAPETETVLAYRNVIAAAYAVRPLVPLQFGTQVATDEQAQALVARHRTPLEQHLDRFEGRVEVGGRLVRTPPPTSSAEEATSGRAYLEARRDERARQATRRSAVVEAYQAAVGEACVDATWDQTAEADGTLSLAFLVPRAEADAVCERLSAVEPEAVEEAHVVGPWAPYSFARL